MSEIFTLSAYETSAAQFFETLLSHHTDLVLDVRLKNSNQLCGFTKQKDLEYLISKITGAVYIHDLRFAPSSVLLDQYLQHLIGWEDYFARYITQIREQDAAGAFQKTYADYHSICILGTATKKRRSHSEALADFLSSDGAKA